jgi:hypothetical protein
MGKGFARRQLPAGNRPPLARPKLQPRRCKLLRRYIIAWHGTRCAIDACRNSATGTAHNPPRARGATATRSAITITFTNQQSARKPCQLAQAIPHLTQTLPFQGLAAMDVVISFGRSSNGRTADSDSASLGSNPSLPANSQNTACAPRSNTASPMSNLA